MYGFHKIPHLQQGVLRSDSDTEFWNFAHSNFHRGQPDLLCLIQRKKQVAQPGDEVASVDVRDPAAAGAAGAGAVGVPGAGPSTTATLSSGQILDIHSIVNGIAAIKRHQTAISSELNELKQSNQLLWQDSMAARTKHQKQQDTINRIVKFLAGVFGHTGSGGGGQGGGGGKGDATVGESPPVRAVVPRRQSRLMIEDGRGAKVGIMEMDEDEDGDEGDEDRGSQRFGREPSLMSLSGHTPCSFLRARG